MKKNSFIEGTVVATLGILLVKMIGILYVVPFNAIIGEHGGALYGYGYTIYQLFLSISSAGFPFAISKITSEYSARNQKKAIKDTYYIALEIISIIAVVVFFFLLIFAPMIGRLIVGKTADATIVAETSFVIRCVSFAILVVPFLSVTRGLLQGYKYIQPYSISQVIEQVARVAILLGGSFLSVKVFHLPIKYAVGISMLAAFFGGFVSYLYLNRKMKDAGFLSTTIKDNPSMIRKREIAGKIFMYSGPFILISLVNNLYTTVDMFLLNNTMKDILHLEQIVIDSVSGTYTTWGIKLNSIILAVSTGLVTSLIPNIVSSFAKNDINDVNDKFNKAFQCVLLVIVPMTLFMSLLATSVWSLFYRYNEYGPVIYRYFVFTALFGSLYTIIINTLQGINKYRLVIATVLMGLITNALLDVPFMLLFYHFGLNVSYGAITAALVGYTLSIGTSSFVLYKKYGFRFDSTLRRIPHYVLAWTVFVITILIMKLWIPTNLSGRLMQIPILMIYGVVSFLIYIFLNDKNGNIEMVFGSNINHLLKKIIKNKKF